MDFSIFVNMPNADTILPS